MKDAILIDTDVLVAAARQSCEAVTYLEAKERTHSLEISAVTDMELLVGCRNKKELRALDELVGRVHVVYIQPKMSELAVNLVRTYYLSHGLLIPDALIAATALELDIPLASRNRKDYQFIPGLKLSQYPE